MDNIYTFICNMHFKGCCVFYFREENALIFSIKILQNHVFLYFQNTLK